jgi:hypothetical protein
MKKIIVFVSFLFLISVTISAQGFYFDIGLGLGKASTKIDGIDFFDTLNSASGGKLSELAVEFGLKLGYGPLGKVPLYIVGELAGMGHRIYDDSNYIQFNSYIIGPGVLFYPIPLIQLGFSVGHSYIANVTDIPGLVTRESEKGFAWNASAAVDLGKGNNGFLIGLKYFYAENTVKTTKAIEKSSLVSVFIKYAYRHKV